MEEEKRPKYRASKLDQMIFLLLSMFVFLAKIYSMRIEFQADDAEVRSKVKNSKLGYIRTLGLIIATTENHDFRGHILLCLVWEAPF